MIDLLAAAFLSGVAVLATTTGNSQAKSAVNFEVKEIMEAIEEIQKYQIERKESQMVGMLNPALDSINAAIKQKNGILFKNSFTLFVFLIFILKACLNAEMIAVMI